MPYIIYYYHYFLKQREYPVRDPHSSSPRFVLFLISYIQFILKVDINNTRFVASLPHVNFYTTYYISCPCFDTYSITSVSGVFDVISSVPASVASGSAAAADTGAVLSVSDDGTSTAAAAACCCRSSSSCSAFRFC